jgi:hypothetical protein
MYEIKTISTESEFEQVLEVWKSVPKLMRDRSKSLAVLSKEFGSVVVAYDKGEIVGTLRYTEWAKLPYYHVGSLYIKPGLLLRMDFTNPKNPTNYMFDYILSEMEKKERYDWYYVRNLCKAYAKVEDEGNNLLDCSKSGHRYHKFVENVLEANEEPVYEMHKMLLARTTWNRPLMIIRCSLDNQYRKHGNFFKNELEFVEKFTNKNQ